MYLMGVLLFSIFLYFFFYFFGTGTGHRHKFMRYWERSMVNTLRSEGLSKVPMQWRKGVWCTKDTHGISVSRYIYYHYICCTY